MLKAAVLKRYQKFWIKRSLRKEKDKQVESHEEFSTLRLLCEGLLGDDDLKLLEGIMMDDLMERIVDDDEAATHSRLVAELQDKTSRFMVNSYLQDGSTPLHIVAGKGFTECVLIMLRKGANPNALHLQLGHSVLHVAAMRASYQTLKCLLAHGADRSFVNRMAGRGRTALHYAAEQGSSPCLLMLLNPTQSNLIERNEEVQRVRAVLDQQDTFGNTALHLACVDGSEECVRMLIESGASVLVRNAEGKSVVDVARTMNSVNANNSTNTTTTSSSNGVNVGAVLFMVLMAAGLDPLTESVALDAASHSASSDEQSILRTPSLLDDAENSSASNNNTVYVIVKDGLLLCSIPPVVYNHTNSNGTNGRNRGSVVSSGSGSSKVSKRLRFVRRSIYGESNDTTNSTNTTTTNTNNTNTNTNTYTNNGSIAKVEVFATRTEAEQRALMYHNTTTNTNTTSNTTTNTSTTTNDSVKPVIAVPAMQRSVWGGNRTTNSSNNNTINATISSNNNATNIPSTSSGDSSGSNTYYTACIDTTKLNTFLSTVPHYYPTTTITTLHKPTHYTNTTNTNNTTNTITTEDDDPLWASYKREHRIFTPNENRRHNTATYSARSANYYSSREAGNNSPLGTAMSNRPVKLLPGGAHSSVNSSVGNFNGNVSNGNSSTNNTTTNTATITPATTTNTTNTKKHKSQSELAAESLLLTTTIATTNAEIFERLCLMEELQQQLNARNKNNTSDTAINNTTNTTNTTSNDHTLIITPPLLDADTEVQVVAPFTAEVIERSSSPLTLEIPTTTTTYTTNTTNNSNTNTNTTTTNNNFITPQGSSFIDPDDTPVIGIERVYSRGSGGDGSGGGVYGDGNIQSASSVTGVSGVGSVIGSGGSVHRMVPPPRTYSPMPDSFKSPALRSPLLHPFVHTGSAVNGGSGGSGGASGNSDRSVSVSEVLMMEGIELTLSDMHSEYTGESSGVYDSAVDSDDTHNTTDTMHTTHTVHTTPPHTHPSAHPSVYTEVHHTHNEGEEEVVWEDLGLGHNTPDSDTDTDSDIEQDGDVNAD